MSNKYGWIAAWTLDGARQRLRSAPVNTTVAQPRFSSSPMSSIRLKNQPRTQGVVVSSLNFVGYGPVEHNGLIFEATGFEFDTQTQANEWLQTDGPAGGKSWIEFAAGVNLIQLSSGNDA
jgi:hypothetical protein